ncbi:MAG: CehA/McbA family metallohydrolase [Sandaracinus sp.]|nr:CehA/McbA family metallohydrolase [Sandaracinus sp.]
MASIPQEPSRYLRAPRLVPTASGATLEVVAWDRDVMPGAVPGVAGVERVLTWQVALDGSLEGPSEGAAHDAIPVWRGEVVDADAELEAHDGDALVRVTNVEGVAEVRLVRGALDVLVWRAWGCAAAPAVVCAPDGTWVAWHHDVREDDARPDVAKWIAVRFVDARGHVLEPEAPMTDRDRDREGVEQSFEFPSLALGDDGALGIFGRGSHNFWRQDLNAEGFSARVALSDGEWGSRGRRVAVCRLGEHVLIARRDRRAVEVDRLEAPRGGRAALVPADTDRTRRQRLSSPARDARDPARAHGLHTYFGDLQQHSAHSDGVGSADEAHWRARHRYGDDFVALTDHEAFLGKRTGPGEWEYLQQVVDRHHVPGRFVALYAYEWTAKMHPGPGHKCVYLPKRGMPLVSRDDVPEGRDMTAAVRAMGALCAPHHVGWTGCDEGGHDEVAQPFWEIVSCHGCYETAGSPLGMRGEHEDQLADVMLRRGHRFGFVGGSDAHGLLWHHGEARKRDPFRTGLTAVQATTLDRDAVLDALRARRCYATSGAKILLDARADGAPMGSEVSSRRMNVRVHAVGTSSIVSVELVGDAGVLARVEPNADEVTFERAVEGDFVYVRVTQRDGEMAWSSPFFAPRG